ncbi:hypothetical protein GUF72_07215 [Xanthomonas citri pv. citri]|nr:MULTISPECIES: hypothetical protein [Xanthomonas]AGI08368.1 Hypothetical Protein XCAW_02585 [Xanthomonas citri subsp. citri Aw12879]MBD1471125.1 hypothetical protein [Xanthomonas citri pv. citri]MBD1474837.1 hypothetical protein [Xanthomonas citri pv. citri]MBD1486970.1 hypothetical protein [Xanthomonas citri pv. citri]MBD1495093.1 hypothetical protein [Xanthomonas citri pv. citri]
MNAKNELTWINPLTGVKEAVPATAKIHVDHVLPQNAIRQIEGFDSLPKGVQNEIMKDPANLQPMIKSANCSKGCKVEAEGAGWMTWNGKPVSEKYKMYLEEAQQDFRTKVSKIIDDNNALKGK